MEPEPALSPFDPWWLASLATLALLAAYIIIVSYQYRAGSAVLERVRCLLQLGGERARRLGRTPKLPAVIGDSGIGIAVNLQHVYPVGRWCRSLDRLICSGEAHDGSNLFTLLKETPLQISRRLL